MMLNDDCIDMIEVEGEHIYRHSAALGDGWAWWWLEMNGSGWEMNGSGWEMNGGGWEMNGGGWEMKDGCAGRADIYRVLLGR